jgi:hypothetical protein
MTTPDGGMTAKHLVFALSTSDGSIRQGWPIDVSATIQTVGQKFVSLYQNQRSALTLVNGALYVAYSGHGGDCADYRGWVLNVSTADPTKATAFATGVRGGGIWGVSGPSSDGTSVFVATGNTFGTTAWASGEAVIRFRGPATFTGQTTDYFTPSNWKALDDADLDLGANNPIVVDVPGATPSQLVVQFGKAGVMYLLDRANLGGVGKGGGQIGEGLNSILASTIGIVSAGAVYATPAGTFVSVRAGGACPANLTQGDLTTIKIAATSPPTAAITWCAKEDGYGSPIVTTPDGKSEFIVWTVGAEITNQLRSFDGSTGELVFKGGGVVLPKVHRFVAPIVARGRIFVASDETIYAFSAQ